MPLLSRAKKRVGNELGSAAMHADAKQTDFCVYLSGILLVGLALNPTLGWWWADPLAALVMVPIIAKEGVDGMRSKGVLPMRAALLAGLLVYPAILQGQASGEPLAANPGRTHCVHARDTHARRILAI